MWCRVFYFGVKGTQPYPLKLVKKTLPHICGGVFIVFIKSKTNSPRGLPATIKLGNRFLRYRVVFYLSNKVRNERPRGLPATIKLGNNCLSFPSSFFIIFNKVRNEQPAGAPRYSDTAIASGKMLLALS